MDDKYAERLRAKLAPQAVSQTLIQAGCPLSAYELIKPQVVDAVHDFHMTGFNPEGFTYDEAQYRNVVLSLNPKSKYKASCAWLVDMRALTSDQVTVLEDIHQHRNEVAHELPKLLVDPGFEVKVDLLLAAVECVRALGIFWERVSVDTNSAFDGQEVSDDDIKSGSYLLMEYLVSIAGLESSPGVDVDMPKNS